MEPGFCREGGIQGDHTEERLLKEEVVLLSRPQGLPNESNFEIRRSELMFRHPPPPGFLLLKVLWLSVDPYLREIMNEENGLTVIPSLQVGQPIMVASISKVIASGDKDYKEGDIVQTSTPVANYVLLSSGHSFIRKIDHRGANAPLNHYLGVLGFPGLTAWLGVNIITQLQPKEEVFISAAAGAVGLLAGQLAKLKGCRVVGSAGTNEKVRMLKELYHFDEAFNYKTEKDLNLTLKSGIHLQDVIITQQPLVDFFEVSVTALACSFLLCIHGARYFPTGFDVYFENVGGSTLEAALENIRRKGRIVACGMVSQYNKDYKDRDGVRNLMHVIGKSLKMEGFLVSDYRHLWDDFVKEVRELLQQGKICYQVDILGRGIGEFTRAFVGLLKGENTGKAVLLVNVDEDHESPPI